ncbi:nuclease activity, partial [Pristimantis euphronides]
IDELRVHLHREKLQLRIWFLLCKDEIYSKQLTSALTTSRRYWVHPINAQRQLGHFSTLYVDLRRYPEKFMSFCCLPILAFDNLLAVLLDDITYRNTFMTDAISAEERLLIIPCGTFLATGESYASLHLQFRVGKSTIFKIVRCTCTVIWHKLQPISMPSPTKETWLRVAAGFQDIANFPNCVGAVDGKHIPVIQPPHSSSKFYHYKKYFSIVLMALSSAASALACEERLASFSLSVSEVTF